MKTKLENTAIKLQEELIKTINYGKKLKGSEANYIDFITAFFLHKIASLEIEIKELKNK